MKATKYQIFYSRSLLYNFQYETSGIRVWKAYEVGKGKLLTYKDYQIQPQQVASLKVVKPFGPRQKERGFISNASRGTQAEIFSWWALKTTKKKTRFECDNTCYT